MSDFTFLLAVAGFDVVVMEQGPRLGPGDFEHDELKYWYLNGIMNKPEESPQTYRKLPTDKAERVQGLNALFYARIVGGSSNHFTGNFWRLRPVDFHERSLLGEIPGTGFADWPITYEELEPYYTQAEWEMGISGQRVNSPFVAPMSKDYPVPAAPLKSSGALFNIAAAKLGLTVVPGPLAIITKPYMGRSACVNCGMCSGFGCHVRARSSSAVTMLPLAEKTGNCEIRANAYVREISTDNSGRVTGVVYFDAQKREIRQRAKVVILSANASETPRLLLLSKSPRFPDGLANSSGIVGKYLMLGGGASASALFEHRLNDYKGVVTGAGIVDYVPSDPKRGFYGGGRMTARGFDTPINYGLRGLRPGAARWGALYKKALREEAGHKMSIQCFVTQLPVETNRVDLDPEVKDDWGLPAMRITSTSHPDDIKNMEFFRQKSIEILEAAGGTNVWAPPVNDSRGSAHNRGTCRMGNDPKTSVVDRFHRAHDVPNLYIVDGSNLVTGGRNHPTMTIQALAFRAADHLVREAKRGTLRSGA